jgi:hypothetical protein
MYSTAADFVARLTLADKTPGTAERAFSTRATQEAQLIPSTGNVTFSAGTSYPVSRIAATRS